MIRKCFSRIFLFLLLANPVFVEDIDLKDVPKNKLWAICRHLQVKHTSTMVRI